MSFSVFSVNNQVTGGFQEVFKKPLEGFIES
jgi:hypothetical protein